jgi:6-pyruvoyltetrahydropterin/6-carboxytetrahydropterin synthase
MSYTIAKQFHLSYSHVLNGLPDDHPCSRLHGHNAIVEIVLRKNRLDEVGFVVDYRDLDQIKQWLDEVYDHRHLNDVVPFNPTAEQLAEDVYGRWIQIFPIVRVGWSETPRTWAWYQP